MFYTVYRITNKINGKFYIGKHQTTNLIDGYMGSGKLLKRAISKYGVDNFSKEILYVFETEEDMNAKEKELVVLGENSYNLCPGGQGGFGYINEQMSDVMKDVRIKNGKTSRTKEQRIEGGRKTRGMKIVHEKQFKPGNKAFSGRKHSDETKAKMRSAKQGRIPWNKGKPRTDEEKEKIRSGVIKSMGPSSSGGKG